MMVLLLGYILVLVTVSPLVAKGADHQKPTITITTPTSASTYTTSTTPLMIGGTASDNVGVTQVTWVNDRGGSGAATGTTSWSASIALQLGTNIVTATARDAAGNTKTDALTVTLTSPPPPPGPITVEWTWRGGTGDAFQMERCVAPQPCTMGAVASLSLSDRSWTDTGVMSTANYCYRLAVTTGASVGPYSNIMCSP
jgi:hypothetical protein